MTTTPTMTGMIFDIPTYFYNLDKAEALAAELNADAAANEPDSERWHYSAHAPDDSTCAAIAVTDENDILLGYL